MASPNPKHALAALLIVLGATAAACGDDESAGPEIGVTLEDVRDDNATVDDDESFEDHDQYEGKTVTVSAEVALLIDDRSFRIGDEELGAPQSVLVVSAPVPDGLDEDDVVRVTGVVKEITISTFEDQFDVTWDPAYESYVGGHAIAASEVEVIDEGEEAALSPLAPGRVRPGSPPMYDPLLR